MKGWENSQEFRFCPQKDDISYATLTHQYNCLQKSYEEMKKKYEDKINELQTQIHQLKSNFWEVIEERKDQTNSNFKSYEDIIISKNSFEKFPILYDIILYLTTKKISTSFNDFCYLVYFTNTKLYKILRDFLPLIPQTRIKDNTKEKRNRLSESLQDIDKINTILQSQGSVPGPVVLSGDAAATKVAKNSKQSALYTYMMCPIPFDQKTISVHMCKTNCGASNRSILAKFDKICDKLEALDYSVDFIATDGDKSFDFLHLHWFINVVEPMLVEEGSFIEKVKKLLIYKRFPISDWMHLSKNGRSHILRNPMCLDPERMTCLNMSEFENAVQLGPIISDKSSIASMKDTYAIELFSWRTFIKLLNHQRFDGAQYVCPFLFVFEASRSKTLSVESRLNLLELSIHQFLFFFNQISKSSSDDFFTPIFTNHSIGTLFGDFHYIIRCINTCVAYSIALCRYPSFSFSRLGTYDNECFFGKIRLFSHFNYSYDNMIKSAVKNLLITDICLRLNYKIKIEKRDSEGGSRINQEELEENSFNFNFTFISNVMYHLFKSQTLPEETIKQFENQVNEYTKYLMDNPKSYPKVTIQSIYSGTQPHYRYTSNSYILSTLPIPNQCNTNSPFNFFAGDRNYKKKIKKISTFQWFCRLLCTLTELSFIKEEIEENSFPKLADDTPEKEAYNIISDWIKDILKENKPGEIENRERPENEIDLPPRELTEKERNLIDKSIKEFLEIRSKNIKNVTKDIAIQKITNDLKILRQYIVSSRDDYLANALNDIDLSLCMHGPKIPVYRIDDPDASQEIEDDEHLIDTYYFENDEDE